MLAVAQDEAGVWEHRLAVLAEGLQTLNTIQRKWVYLEPIFARGALPNEQPRFRRVIMHLLPVTLPPFGCVTSVASKTYGDTTTAG